jgi:hypothetical protein
MRENRFFVTCVQEEKLSLYKSLGLQEFEAPRIYRKSVLQGGNIISPENRRSFPQEDTPGTNFC